MAYAIPKMEDLVKIIAKLDSSYTSAREVLDKQRYFAAVRAKTVNPDRMVDIEFIQSVARNVAANKNAYHSFDNNFPEKTYTGKTAPFLKNAMVGAMLLSLIEITTVDYFWLGEEAVKKRSALGQCILNILSIDKLSDVPHDEIKACLEALESYLETVNRRSETRIKWHPQKENYELKSIIQENIKDYTEKSLACQ
jgi:hypothetical protein